jgi:hypothetical protein
MENEVYLENITTIKFTRILFVFIHLFYITTPSCYQISLFLYQILLSFSQLVAFGVLILTFLHHFFRTR